MYGLWAASSLAVLVCGCDHQLPPMATAAATLPAPGPREASIVFVKPVSPCDTIGYSVVVDEQGHFVGNLTPGTRVAYPVSPGTHVFYGWSSLDLRLDRVPNFNTAAAIRVDAVEGQTEYVALLVFKPGIDCQTWALIDMYHVKPHDGLWGDLQSWLGATTPLAVDRVAGQAALDAKPAFLQTYLELGQWKLHRLDNEKAHKDRREALRAEEESPN
jgi:hypothetical protein